MDIIHLGRRAVFPLGRVSHKPALCKRIVGKKLLFFLQESDILEIRLIRILNLRRRPIVLFLNNPIPYLEDYNSPLRMKNLK